MAMNIHEDNGPAAPDLPRIVQTLPDDAERKVLSGAVSTDNEDDGIDDEKTLVCCVQLTYLGFSLVDWRSTKAVLNWAIGDRLLFRRSQHQLITLFCHDRFFRAEDADDGEPVFLHPISSLYQLTRGRDGLALAYITHNARRDRFYCHMFLATTYEVIATVHDAWSQSKDHVKSRSKTMDLLSVIPPEKQGLLTLSTALQIEEHSFNVRYLGQLSTTASTGSSGLVDNIVEAAVTRQREQQLKRSQAVKEGRLQQSRRDKLKQNQPSATEAAVSGPEDCTDGVISDLVVSTTAKVKEIQEGLVVRRDSSDEGLTSPRDVQRSQSTGTAKTRFFNLIRRSGSNTATTAGDSPTTASSHKTEDCGRSKSDSRLTPASSSEAISGSPSLTMHGARKSVSSADVVSSPEKHDPEVAERADDGVESKCSSRASTITGSTLTAFSTGIQQAADSGDSGVSAASTPEGDSRYLLRASSSSALSDNTSVSSEKSLVPLYHLSHRLVNLCITAESIRFYDLRKPAEGAIDEEPKGDSNELTKRLCWERKLSSVSYCAKGIVHSASWCLIISESASNRTRAGFVCYMFSCQTEEETVAIMEALTKSFNVAFELHRNPPVVIRSPFCASCPLYIMHQLCTQVNVAPHPKAAIGLAMKVSEGLPKEDRAWLADRTQSVQQFSEDVQLQVLVGLLRGVFERLQKDHVHSDGEKPVEVDDTDEATSKPRLGALSRARRTLANSFEGLRKKDKPNSSPALGRPTRPESPGLAGRHSFSTTGEQEVAAERRLLRKRNSSSFLQEGSRSSPATSRGPLMTPPGSPTLSVPLHTPPTLRRRPATPNRKTSFRHSIYKNAHTTPGGVPLSPNKMQEADEKDDEMATARISPMLTPRHSLTSSSSARGMWKRAIDEQLMLVRLEREPPQDLASEEMSCRRLAYADVLETSQRDKLSTTWKELLSTGDGDRAAASAKIDVRQAVADGIPKTQRGQAWKVLCDLRNSSKSRRKGESNYSVVVDGRNSTDSAADQYEQLRDTTTTFLHAILIDLGRTFPGHEYFQETAGPGQRSLYNVLRAYANLDQDVGYCQGLSFVVGVIVMHVSSDKEAFQLLSHLMYDLNLRDQYKPDMARLQVQLYQLSRLLHDFHPKLYELFEKHDVAPFFYAAPWFLTLFSTQFPLYFSSRVLDLIFLDGRDAVFKVCLVLLRHGESELLACHNFEQILNSLKSLLPAIAARVPEIVFKEAMQMDIREKLLTFEVEHSVLQDLDSTHTMSDDLQAANTALKSQHTELIQQLAVARGNALRLQDSVNELTGQNQYLTEEVERYESQTASQRQTISQLQEQLEASQARESKTNGTDESDGGGVMSRDSWAVRPKLKRNSNLRRRLSVPAFPVERRMVKHHQQQLSMEDLLESPLAKLEGFSFEI